MDKELKEENILNQSLDVIMSDRFGKYSKYIIQGRALPDVRDGLKPVQRRIIYAMNELGLFSDKAYKKSARVVGEVIGKYHPHGDSSIYEAMVRMAQDWKMNLPLIDMHGNKGSIDDDPAAAMRYTEARLAKVTKTMLDGIKKKTVTFAPNFDDSESEPTVLPALLPNLLVNGAKGIASGYATEMPPHNLGEILDAAMAKIKEPSLSNKKIAKIIKGPDFPTGGEVIGADGIIEAIERGRGRVIIRSKYEVNDSKTKPFIKITEIPYGVVKSKLVRAIDEIAFNKTISGIKEVRDETDRNGITIMIELDAGTEPDKVLNYLLSKTDMQVYYTYNNVTISQNAPKVMGLNQLIDEYIAFQREIQRKKMSFDLARDKDRLEVIDGLIKVASMADKVIDCIRNAEGSKKGVVEALVKQFQFSENQASAIADLKLYRLSKTDQSVYLEEKKLLDDKVTYYNKILNSDEEFDNFLVELMSEFKETYATPRRTVVTESAETIEINMEELIKHEDVYIGVSKMGYIKRFSNRIFDSNEVKSYGLKPGDSLVYLNMINTMEKVLVFTNKGRYVFIPGHKVVEAKWRDVGKHLNDYALLDVDETVVEVISVDDFDVEAFVAFATKNGKIKKVAISDFQPARYNKPFVCVKLEDGDEVVSVVGTNGTNQFIMISASGKAIKYREHKIAPSSSKTKGVRGISLASGDYLAAMFKGHDDQVVGLVSNRAWAKRIKVSDIHFGSKSTQGKPIYRQLKGNPHVVIDAKIIDPSDEIAIRDFSDEIQIKAFRDITITSSAEGFSSLGIENVINAKIMKFFKFAKDAKFIQNRIHVSEEDQFKKSESAIDDAMNQISMDDILKDIK